jgi:hypothetical protein
VKKEGRKTFGKASLSTKMTNSSSNRNSMASPPMINPILHQCRMVVIPSDLNPRD